MKKRNTKSAEFISKKNITFLVILGILIFVFIAIYFSIKTKYVLIGFEVSSADKQQTFMQLIPSLEQNNIKATFFVTGKFAKFNHEIVEDLHNRGHEISCQLYDEDKLLLELDKLDKEYQMYQCIEAVYEIIKEKPKGFKAPRGEIDDESFDVIKDLDFNYDASGVDSLKMFFPKPSVNEVGLSSFLIFPLDDYFFIRSIRAPNLFFTLSRVKRVEFLKITMHPNLVMGYPDKLDKLFAYYNKKGVKSITYSEFLELSS